MNLKKRDDGFKVSYRNIRLVFIVLAFFLFMAGAIAAPCTPITGYGTIKNFSGTDLQNSEVFLHAYNINKSTHYWSNNSNQIYIGSNYYQIGFGNVGDTESHNCYEPGDHILIEGINHQYSFNLTIIMLHWSTGTFVANLISNMRPELSSVSLDNENPFSSSVIHCNYTGYSDVFTPGLYNNSINENSSAPNKTYYLWYVNGVHILTKQDDPSFIVGVDGGTTNDVINCSVIVYDGLDNSSEYFSTNAATVQGSGPTIISFSFNSTASNPTPVGGDVNFSVVAIVDGGWNYSFYVCNASATNSSLCISHPSWVLCNTSDNLNGSQSSCLYNTASDTTQESYVFHAYVCDKNMICSSVTNSYHVNHKESITFQTPPITPSSPYTNNDLTCNYMFNSAVDSDTDNSIIVWYNSSDGINFRRAGVNSSALDPSLPSSYTTRNQYWLCEVIPRDGHGMTGDAVNSSSVQILNSPPQINQSTFYFGSNPAQDYDAPPSASVSCPSPQITDPDGETVFDENYKWYTLDSSGNVIHVYTTYGKNVNLSDLGVAVDDRVLCSLDACNQGTSTCSGYVNTTNNIRIIGATPYFVIDPDDGGLTVDNPVNIGGNITFNATAKHPANSTYRLWICRVNDINLCSSDPSQLICVSDPAYGYLNGPESASCTYRTNNSVDTEENTTWYAFACDASSISYCSSAYIDQYHVNHPPTGFANVEITPPRPDRASDIVCAISGFMDPDWDDVQDQGSSSLFRWYMAPGNVSLSNFPTGFTLQPSYTSYHLGNGVVHKNETWVCEVTPVDRHGLSAGSPQRVSTYTYNALPRPQTRPTVIVVEPFPIEGNRTPGQIYYGDKIQVITSPYSDPDLDPEVPVNLTPPQLDPEGRPHAINWQISLNPGAGINGQTDADFVDITDNFDMVNFTTGSGTNHGNVGDILRVCQGFYDGYDYNDMASVACSMPFALSDPGRIAPNFISLPADTWVYNWSEERPGSSGLLHIYDTNEDVPVTAGKPVIFTAAASHPTGNYDFIVCSNNSNPPVFNGVNFNHCTVEYCRDENVSSGALANCSYITKQSDGVIYWTAYVCNRQHNKCRADSTHSPLVVNHRPDLTIRHPSFYGGSYSNPDGYDIAVSPGQDNLTQDSTLTCEYNLNGIAPGQDMDGDVVNLDSYVWMRKNASMADWEVLSWSGQTLPKGMYHLGDEVKCSVRLYDTHHGDNGAGTTINYDVFGFYRESSPVTIEPDTIKPVINSSVESFGFVSTGSTCIPVNPNTGFAYDPYPTLIVTATDNGNVSYVHATIYYPNGTVLDVNNNQRNGDKFIFSLGAYSWIKGHYIVDYYAVDSSGLVGDTFRSSFEVTNARTISGVLKGLYYPINATVSLERKGYVYHNTSTDSSGYYQFCMLNTSFDLRYSMHSYDKNSQQIPFNHEILFRNVSLGDYLTIPLQIEPLVRTEGEGLKNPVVGFAVNSSITSDGRVTITYLNSEVYQDENTLVMFTCRDWEWSTSTKECNDFWKPMYSHLDTSYNTVYANMQGKPRNKAVAFMIAHEPKCKHVELNPTTPPKQIIKPHSNAIISFDDTHISLHDEAQTNLVSSIMLNTSYNGAPPVYRYLINNIIVPENKRYLTLNNGNLNDAVDENTHIVLDYGTYSTEDFSDINVTVRALNKKNHPVFIDAIPVDNFFSTNLENVRYWCKTIVREWTNKSKDLVLELGANKTDEYGALDDASFDYLECSSINGRQNITLSNSSITLNKAYCFNNNTGTYKLRFEAIQGNNTYWRLCQIPPMNLHINQTQAVAVKTALGEYKLQITNYSLKPLSVGTISTTLGAETYLDPYNLTYTAAYTNYSMLYLYYNSTLGYLNITPLNGMEVFDKGRETSAEFVNERCIGVPHTSSSLIFNNSYVGEVVCMKDPSNHIYRLRLDSLNHITFNLLHFQINSTKLKYILVTTYDNITNITEGDYDLNYIVTYANGSTKNIFEWVAVYNQTILGINIEDTYHVGLPVSVNLYRPGSNVLVSSFINDNLEGYEGNLINRNYDIEMDYCGFGYVLRDVPLTSLLNLSSVNYLDASQIDMDRSLDNVIRGFAVNSSAYYDGEVSIYYDDDEWQDNEGSMNIYKCSSIDFSDLRCTGGWTRLNGVSIDKVNNIVKVPITSFSGYALTETLSKPLARQPRSKSGHGVRRTEGVNPAIWANFSKSIQEKINETKKLLEHVKRTVTEINEKQIEQVGVDTTEISKELYQGQPPLQVVVHVTNEREKPISLKAEVIGEASKLVTLKNSELRLLQGRGGNFNLEINVPISTRPGLYSGWLVLSAGSETTRIPIELRVSELQEDQLIVQAQPLQRTTKPGKPIKVEVNMLNPLPSLIDVVLSFEVYHVDTEKVIHESTHSVQVKSSASKVFNLDTPANAELGKYIVRVNARYTSPSGREVLVPTSTFVELAYPWYSKKIFSTIPLWWLIVLVLVAATSTAGYEYYEYRKEKAKKYQMVVDFSQLPQPSARSAFIGHVAETNIRTFTYLEDLKTHAIVAGATGGGKTVAAQVLVEEALMKGVSVIVFDPTAQWTGFLRKCKEKSMLKHYGKFSMKKRDARAFNGNVYTIKNPRQLIDIKKYIKPGEITVFTIHHLDPKEIDILVTNTIRQIFKAHLEESQQLKLLLVYDEVHRLLPKFGGSGAGFIQIERACREFRKWGVGLILISQVLSDFVGEIKANISTEIQMRTRDEGDLERLRLKYGEDILKSIVKASVGTGMLENPQYNKGRAYFVDFRPLLHSVTRLSDEELEKYDKYNAIIDDLAYQIEQLEAFKIDTFDYKLELKLALDKVKTGNFNMVDIYLEGLIPRIKAEWQKLGKTPKKREIKLISDEELQESINLAQKARAQYLKSQKGAKTVQEQPAEVQSEEKQPASSQIKISESLINKEVTTLVPFIRRAVAKGYSEIKIRAILAKKKWLPEAINKAFDIVHGRAEKDPALEKLENAIKQLLEKGYDRSKLKSALLKKGWSEEMVDKAFDDIK